MDSDRPTFHWADYVVLGVVLSVSAVIGIFYALRGRRQRTTNEFMVASRQMGFFPVGMSLLASLFTGIYIQGMVSEVYFRGAMASFSGTLPFLIAAYIAGKIFLPAFYKLRLNSVYQYLEMRFNRSVSNCCLIIGYLFMILHAGIATFAACLVLTTVSNMNFLTAVIVLSGVCTFYTALGGIKAVVWADCFQMFLMYSPLVAAVSLASASIGFGNVWDISAKGDRLDILNFSIDPTEYLTFWTAIVGGAFSWMPALCVMQYQVQRYNTCEDAKTAHMAISLFTGGGLVVVILCGLAGLSVYAVFVDCDPFSSGILRFRDELLPYFALKSFHHLPGIPGLLVSGLCGAALSTVSSVINSIVIISGEHIVTKIWRNMSDSKYLLLTKLLAVCFGAVNVAMTYIMSSLGDILPTLIGLVGITSGPVMGVFLLGFLIPKCNSKGALVGFTAGSLLGLWIFIGSTMYSKTPESLPLSVEGCPVELLPHAVNYSTDMNMTTGLYSAVSASELSVTRVGENGSLHGMMNSTQLVLTHAITSGPTTGHFSLEIIREVNSTAEQKDENVLVLYLISRWWYPTITTCTVVVAGLVTSFVTGFNDPSLMDPVLFVDWYSVFCWCRKRKNKQMENKKRAIEVQRTSADPSEGFKPELEPLQTLPEDTAV